MKILKIIIFFVLTGIIFAFLLSKLNLFANSNVPPPPYIDLRQMEKPSIEKIVKKGLEGTTGDYAFFIKNLKTGEEYSLQKDKQYKAGSLYKLWVMAVVFEKIKNGNLNYEDILSDSVASLNGKFGLTQGFLELPQDSSIEISVKDAIYQMITISHNYSALLLLNKVGSESVTKFLKDNGFVNSTIIDDPKTSAEDVKIFFEKVYKKEFVDSDKMLDILKDQTLNDGIPKYLPKNIKVAHKTGDLGWFKHDGGIIFANKGDYIFVGMSESEFPDGAQERIAGVSKAVYEYFTAN